MLFVRTRIFVVREFGILCSSERIKFPNIGTNRFLFRRRFCKKDEDSKSFRPKIFLFVRIYFCWGEDFCVRPKIFFVRTNKILSVRTFFVDPNIFKICQKSS